MELERCCISYCESAGSMPPMPVCRANAALAAKDSEGESEHEKAKAAENSGEKEEVSIWGILRKDVLPNPYVWLFALSYFFVYLARQGSSSWFVHYLMNVKGVEDLGTAAAQVSGLEVGGFFGALSAGAVPAGLSTSCTVFCPPCSLHISWWPARCEHAGVRWNFTWCLPLAADVRARALETCRTACSFWCPLLLRIGLPDPP